MRKIIISNEQAKEFVYKIEKGESTVLEIAKELNISRNTLSKYIKSFRKIDPKIAGGRYRKYKFNVNYFKFIDSVEKSYWLGLITADGNISKTKLSIGLIEEDSYILEKFMKDLNHKGNLYTKNSYIKKDGYLRKTFKTLNVYSDIIVKDLAKFKILPNKTFNTIIPDEILINKIMFWAFIRGYFDGDGCITKIYKKFSGKFLKYKVCIPKVTISGSKELISCIIKYTNNLKWYMYFNNNIYHCELRNIEDIKIFYNSVYDNSKDYYLTRKKEKMEECIKEYGKVIILESLHGCEIK